MEVIIGVPSDADTPKFKTSVGTVRYVPEMNAMVWSIKSFPGGKEYLVSEEGFWTRLAGLRLCWRMFFPFLVLTK